MESTGSFQCTSIHELRQREQNQSQSKIAMEIRIAAEVEKIWITHDHDQDNSFSFDELKSYLNNTAYPHLTLNNDQVKSVFKQIDKSTDGVILKNEMEGFLYMLIKENKNIIFLMDDGNDAQVIGLFDNSKLDAWRKKAQFNIIRNKIAKAMVTDYIDFMTPPSLFNCAQKDDQDCIQVKIISKTPVSHDTYKFELEFSNQDWIGGFWPGSHVIFHAKINGKMYTRKYTPVSAINVKGNMVFIIKIYRPNKEFPQGGLFTQYLENQVSVGDSILVEGPFGQICYRGQGKFRLLDKKLSPKTQLFMLGAGSGITPLISIAQSSVKSNDGIQMSMMISNKTPDDILCQDLLTSLNKQKNCSIHHTLTRYDAKKHPKHNNHPCWTGMTGRINIAMMLHCGLPIPEPRDHILIIICGPDNFCDAMDKMLIGAGYSPDLGEQGIFIRC